MSSHRTTRIDISVRDRLLQIAKRENRDFNVILNLYYQERFLARLAVSRYRKRFFLKGGLLLLALESLSGRLSGRPTKDVDLRAEGVGNDPDSLQSVFVEVCTAGLPDGVIFEPHRMTVERITEDADYQGIRLKVPVGLAGARGSVQVDIGFGDVVTPGPREMEFPVLLGEMSPPAILVYSVETVVAEKFEAMISLSLINSRMKDFFDLDRLAQTHEFAGSVLQQAAINTFDRRGTRFLPNPAMFQPSFASDESRRRQWLAFLRRIHLMDTPRDFADVMALLRDFLCPVHIACMEDRFLSAKWSPDLLRWV
ncbi:MAG: nucleotidyl transferase AbiEii/AbiGii toxin family protein [Chloroflexi bacterium]|nr:nucleotidyl transferase AbiEii/AbiGii toxin family protein [Chloroflexota bacterium]